MSCWWREKWLYSCIMLAWHLEAWANHRITRYAAWHLRETGKRFMVIRPPAN